MAIRRILVPTDFSTSAARALDLAFELGSPTRAEIVLLYAVEPVPYTTAPDIYGPVSPYAFDYLTEQEQWARTKLAKMTKRLRGRRMAVHAVVQTGAPYAVILETAARLAVDLIVMGTQGRTGLSHLLIGSVAEKVVRLATCPVVTVGTKQPAAKQRTRKQRRSR